MQTVQGLLNQRTKRPLSQQEAPGVWNRLQDSRHGLKKEKRILLFDQAACKDHPGFLLRLRLIMVEGNYTPRGGNNLLVGKPAPDQIRPYAFGQRIDQGAPGKSKPIDRQGPRDADKPG